MIDEKTRMAGNKSIALFLGYEYIPNTNPFIHNFIEVTWYQGEKISAPMSKNLIGWVNKNPTQHLKGREVKTFPYSLCRNTKQLPFHKTWNWIMKTIEQIEKKYPNIKIIPEGEDAYVLLNNSTVYERYSKGTKKDSTWYSCVQALTLINS